MVTPTDAKCAACGKGGDGLKKCGACELVRYCGAACQRAHRPTHKRECKKRAAELHDEALFKQPPSREECPICFLELPIEANMQMYKWCCGKFLCYGCALASAEQTEDNPCPFCRKPVDSSDEDRRECLDRRIESNDANAIYLTGTDYLKGGEGVEQDIGKALDLFHRAAELGSTLAHSVLGDKYFNGNGVQANHKKAVYHFETAAMAGDVGARDNLGVIEGKRGNLHRAMKHFLISASAGYDDSLEMVRNAYGVQKDLKPEASRSLHELIGKGFVTKYVFEKTLRAHKKSRDELKSEWRDKAAARAAEKAAAAEYVA